MMTPILPFAQDLVLLGGGHTHALVLHRWAMAALPGARVSLVNPAPTAPYTGMLPGHVAGHYARRDLEIDLVVLARRAGARLVLDRAEGIDLENRRVHLAGRAPLVFDVLSVDIGISSDLPALPGFAEHAVPAKPLGAYALRWAQFLEDVAVGRCEAQVVVIGGGVAGVELALAMAWRLRAVPRVGVTVLEQGTRALPNIGRAARARLLRELQRTGIELRTACRVAAIDAGGVYLQDGTRLAAGLVVGAAGARPQDWLRGTGLDLTDGFITVGPTLQSVSHSKVFAAGDCAHMHHAPRPKAGVYAVRQAPVLLANLNVALMNKGRMRGYRPQRDYLKLVSLGDQCALADKWALPLQGRWLWRLKDRIDARFMRQFRPRPPRPPAIPRHVAAGVAETIGARPLCGGCGAKMGADALAHALAAVPVPARSDVEIGAGDDAALLRVGGQRQVIATDHLRAFVEDPFLMARIAAVHALGDIWAMGAQPQAALASITLPHMAPVLQQRSLAEAMAGAQAVFGPEGVAIVGGHSAMGAEMTLGFTVTGLVGARILTKSGGRPGDALILVKPLGSGVILAAEMQMQARGDHVAGALACMTMPQGAAAAVLAEHATAMTDVTGFGLAGHLAELLQTAGCGAILDPVAIPVLPGAEWLAAQGHAATLAPANRAAVAGLLDIPDTERAALLCDPQTAGGLLAALPPDAAGAALAGLHAAGYVQAAVIGHLCDGPVRIDLRDCAR